MKNFLFSLFIFLFFLNISAAQRMDFMLYNLGHPTVNVGDKTFTTNSVKNFKLMSTQFAAVMAPMFFGEADTRGAEGFEIGIGYSLTKINLSSEYWEKSLNDEPTRTGKPPFYNAVDLHVHKGLPFGVKVYGNLRYYLLSEMVSGGIGVDYAINEGMRKWPDVSFGIGYNRLFAASDLNMSMTEFRVKFSKTIIAAKEIKMIPFLSYSHLITWSSSNRLGGFFDMTHIRENQIESDYEGNAYWGNFDGDCSLDSSQIDDSLSRKEKAKLKDDYKDACIQQYREGTAFAFDEQTIHIDRLALGFKFIRGHFSFNLETVLPFNAYKAFSMNAGFAFVY